MRQIGVVKNCLQSDIADQEVSHALEKVSSLSQRNCIFLDVFHQDQKVGLYF